MGEQCERCLPGYYGDALALPHGNCQGDDLLRFITEVFAEFSSDVT